MVAATLKTLITYNPWSVGPATLLDDIAVQFEDLGVHHVAVVDAHRRVVGMLSETDLLRARQAQRSALVACGSADDSDAPLVFARDAMSRDVLTVSATADFQAALALLLERHVHALPVVEQQRLVGMITSRDFIREFSYGEVPASRLPASCLLADSPPATIGPAASLDEALLAMHDQGVSSLVVADQDHPLGIVSQRDIVRDRCRRDEQEDYHPEMRLVPTVLQVTRACPAIRPDQRLFEVAAAMVDHKLQAVVVTDSANQLRGLINEDDLLQAVYDAQA